MRGIIVIAVAALLIGSNGPVFAFGTSSDSSQDTKVGGDEGVTTKGTIDDRHSDVLRASRTATKSRDLTSGESARKTGQGSKSGGFDITVSSDVGFLRALRTVEANGIEPFATCKVLSRPKLLADFGLSAVRGNVVYTTMAEGLNQAAAGNAQVDSVTEEQPVRAYIDCLAIYGVVIRQGFINLNKDLQLLPFVTKKKNSKGLYEEIKGIGYEDFMYLSAGAIMKAIRNFDQIKDKYRDILDDPTPCRFEGKLDVIQCGGAQLTLGTKPALSASGINIMGNVMGSGQYGGFSATYKISNGWSYTQAFETMKSDNTGNRWAKELSKAVEDSEGKGNAVEALVSEKSSYDRSRSSKTNISVDKFIPTGNQ